MSSSWDFFRLINLFAAESFFFAGPIFVFQTFERFQVSLWRCSQCRSILVYLNWFLMHFGSIIVYSRLVLKVIVPLVTLWFAVTKGNVYLERQIPHRVGLLFLVVSGFLENCLTVLITTAACQESVYHIQISRRASNSKKQKKVRAISISRSWLSFERVAACHYTGLSPKSKENASKMPLKT